LGPQTCVGGREDGAKTGSSEGARKTVNNKKGGGDSTSNSLELDVGAVGPIGQGGVEDENSEVKVQHWLAPILIKKGKRGGSVQTGRKKKRGRNRSETLLCGKDERGKSGKRHRKENG